MIWTPDIKDFARESRPENDYFAKAWDFINAWLGGQEEFILHTSGSTGTPKPIIIKRNQLSASAIMTGEALQLGPGTKALVCPNVSYIAGLMMLVRAMELDWDISVTEPASNPLLELPEDDHFDFVALVPMQLAAIMENPSTKEKTHHLGKILLGGAPVSLSLQKKIQEIPTPIYLSYGMTETVSHIALRRLNGPDASAYFTFLPNLTFGVDDRGCLYVRGAVTNGEKVQTNDLVHISSNTFEWLGRADHVINSGGIKIILDKIDAQIAQVFDQMNLPNAFFAWSEPDEKLGQKLVLIIEGELNQFTKDEVQAEIRAHISAYETPKRIYFADQFEKTATGKVDKRSTFQYLQKL